MTAVNAMEDPDSFDAAAMARIAEAATLLRDIAVPRPAAVDQVVRRVRFDAFMATVAGTVAGSISRVGRAAPELLGLSEPLEDHTDPTDGPTE